MTLHTTAGIGMNSVMLGNYMRNLVNQFFKILPMRENEEESLGTYMESLRAELLGCQGLIVVIDNDPMYMTLLAILQYLIQNQDAHPKIFRREVFKAISICNKLKARYAAPVKAVEDA